MFSDLLTEQMLEYFVDRDEGCNGAVVFIRLPVPFLKYRSPFAHFPFMGPLTLLDTN